MIVVAFPGQGAQKLGMATNLSPNQLAAFNKAGEILGYDLIKLCNEGPFEKLSQTQFTQPALLVTCISYWFEISSNTRVEYFAGHSLGQITALVASGAIDFEDGVKIAAKRGQLMSQEAKGGMVALLGLELPQIEELVTAAKSFGTINVANYNSPSQYVISGEAKALEYVAQQGLTMGAKRIVPLPVSGAFHSPLMQPITDEFSTYLAQFAFKDPQLPVISNINNDLIISAEQIQDELGRQLTGSVQWIQNIQNLEALGMTKFIEVGPSPILSGLTKRITRGIEITLYP